MIASINNAGAKRKVFAEILPKHFSFFILCMEYDTHIEPSNRVVVGECVVRWP